MSRRLALALLFASTAMLAPAADAPAGYQAIVRRFADTLLEKGRDVHGSRKTALWCSVINLDDWSVPREAKEVPLRKGDRPQDRAVGGCNLHQDVSTLHVFRTLSALTGDPRYAQAVQDYVRDFFAVAQHPKSGLLAWGEHMYYDVHRDAVHLDYGRSGVVHELIGWTTPWEVLWEVDPQATTRAIEGLEYHFYGEDPAQTGWLFNRHGNWNGTYSPPSRSQPWIKHAALYAYAYAFLHARTGSPDARARAVGTGELYWNHRDPVTGLTPVCLPGVEGKAGHLYTDLTSFPLAAYFLLKAGRLGDAHPEGRERGLGMVKAFFAHAWDPATGGYRRKLNTDGTPFVESDPQAALAAAKVRPPGPWATGYGGADSGLPRLGRIAAYCARTEGDGDCRSAAARIAGIIAAAPIPADVSPVALGFVIHLNLDLYDLTREASYLGDAERYAKVAVEQLFANGLVRNAPGSGIYDAQSGAGDLLSSLLRLSLRLDGRQEPAGIHDWSF
jgi:hypothetical protein